MKKNIILITILPIWSMNHDSGGKALFNTINTYLNNDYNLFIITNQINDYSKLKNINKENIFYIDTDWYMKCTKENKNNKFLAYIYFKQFEKKAYKYICNILKKINKDNTILYAYEVNAVKPAKKASKRYNIPLVTRFQGTIMSQYKKNLYYKIRKYPHIQALSTKADLVIMTDDGTKGNVILDEYKNNSKRLFIKNGVNILDEEITPIDKDKLRKSMGIPENVTVLLTVSRLEGWKRVDRSIKAFKELKDYNQYRLIIVGEGSERENLEKLSKELGIYEYVIFTGAIKNENVKYYMQLADIFLSFYDLSNVGNPLLEALCLGKAIITYDVGDTYKIINGNNGILLQDISAVNIAKTIQSINDEKIIKEYSKNAALYASQNLYSWKKRMEIELEEINKLFKR